MAMIRSGGSSSTHGRSKCTDIIVIKLLFLRPTFSARPKVIPGIIIRRIRLHAPVLYALVILSNIIWPWISLFNTWRGNNRNQVSLYHMIIAILFSGNDLSTFASSSSTTRTVLLCVDAGVDRWNIGCSYVKVLNSNWLPCWLRALDALWSLRALLACSREAYSSCFL